MNDTNFQQPVLQTQPSLAQRPWFHGAVAFILSIPAGIIIKQVVGLIFNPAFSLEIFFL